MILNIKYSIFYKGREVSVKKLLKRKFSDWKWSQSSRGEDGMFCGINGEHQSTRGSDEYLWRLRLTGTSQKPGTMLAVAIHLLTRSPTVQSGQTD